MKRLSLFLLALSLLAGCSKAPLPSWHESPQKQRILDFVGTVSNPASNGFVPQSQRIAVFDLDGTLASEKPNYSNYLFLTSFVQEAASRHPQMKTVQPFAAILDNDTNYLRSHYTDIYTQVFADSSLQAYHRYADAFLHTPHPLFKQPFYLTYYQPMAELIQLLQQHQFKVFICSGSQQEFVRRFGALAFGLPPQQCIGSTMQWDYHNGRYTRTNQLLRLNDHAGKCQGILDRIGSTPILCVGNSTGDAAMLGLTDSSPLPHLNMILIHDDAVREFAYKKPALEELATQHNWLQISMKKQFKQVFSSQ